MYNKTAINVCHVKRKMITTRSIWGFLKVLRFCKRRWKAPPWKYVFASSETGGKDKIVFWIRCINSWAVSFVWYMAGIL